MDTDAQKSEIAHNAISPLSKPAAAGLIHKEITQQIIGAAFEVHNTLGYGFLEQIYHKALALELQQRNLVVRSEHPIEISYKGVNIGQYYADLLINDCVLVEVKIAEKYHQPDEGQLVNLLTAARIKLGLLLNFGRAKVEFKRFVV